MKNFFYFLIFSLIGTMYGQKSFNDYAKFYPIGDDPNIRFITSYVKQEDILFEANPVLKLSFYNNFVKGLINEDKHTQAWYISFKPQIRMYTDNSLPIKTPSYRIFLGTQHLFNLPTNNDASMKFWGLLLESGHYSNGQSDCVFSEDFSDGSIDCENIYKTINSSTNLSEILNRRSGNFSTNLTKLILNYRTYLLDEDYFPKQSHSVNLGYTLYHNKFLGIGDFGGFTNDDIAIYGSSRFMVAYEFMRVFKKNIKKRYTLKQKITYINNAHSSVEPFRLESIFSMYPFSKSKSLGFTFSYIYGHDNYNYRFVDSGQQVSIGITWSQFPAITLKSL